MIKGIKYKAKKSRIKNNPIRAKRIATIMLLTACRHTGGARAVVANIVAEDSITDIAYDWISTENHYSDVAVNYTCY
jgi:hypothetical protein